MGSAKRGYDWRVLSSCGCLRRGVEVHHRCDDYFVPRNTSEFKSPRYRLHSIDHSHFFEKAQDANLVRVLRDVSQPDIPGPGFRDTATRAIRAHIALFSSERRHTTGSHKNSQPYAGVKSTSTEKKLWSTDQTGRRVHRGGKGAWFVWRPHHSHGKSEFWLSETSLLNRHEPQASPSFVHNVHYCSLCGLSCRPSLCFWSCSRVEFI
jgi:hypothetical protein